MNPGDINFGGVYTLHTRPFTRVLFQDWRFDEKGVAVRGTHDEIPWGPRAIYRYNLRRSQLARRHPRLRRLLHYRGPLADRHILITSCSWVGRLDIGEIGGLTMVGCTSTLKKVEPPPEADAAIQPFRTVRSTWTYKIDVADDEGGHSS